MNNRQSEPKTKSSTEHVPVLLQKVLEQLDVQKDGVYFDGTFGGAGYSIAIATQLDAKSGGQLIATDVDAAAIERAKEKIKDLPIKVYQKNFSEIALIAQQESITGFDGIVVDLGISSDHLANGQTGSGRGFSFKNENEPLVMTLQNEPGPDQTTAHDVVNGWDEESLVAILQGFGGERFAGRIARGIVQARAQAEIKTVGDLVKIIYENTPKAYHHRKTHPATKTFQAIRIAVNGELEHLKTFISDALGLLKPGGVLVIVSFHGGENKIVRTSFRDAERAGLGRFIGKRPIEPERDEVISNPRSRSAHMRVFKTYES